MTDDEGFRTCGACRRRWSTPADFLDDAGLSVVGLQVAKHVPEANLLVFEHACGSSVSVLTSRLRFLLGEPTAGTGDPDLYDTDTCLALCRVLREWALCDRPCVNARDRRLLQVVLSRKGGDLG